MRRMATLGLVTMVVIGVVSGTASAAISAPAAESTLQVRLRIDVPMVPSDASPNDNVTVTLFKKDPQSGDYSEVATGPWTAVDDAWTTAVEPGMYRVRFTPDDERVAVEYLRDSKSMWYSDLIDVQPGEIEDLGTIALDPWGRTGWRLDGIDRYATAAAIAGAHSPMTGHQRSTTYLVSGTSFPDALAAGPAAANVGGTILMSAASGLPAVTRDALLHPAQGEVVIVGGAGALAISVENAVRETLPSATITRVGGADRYATADAIVRHAFAAGSGGQAIIATGRDYPDALAASAAAAYTGGPVILVDGDAATLSSQARDLIAYLGSDSVLIVGGTGAVSSGIEADLGALLAPGVVSRVGGTDRYETASKLNTTMFGYADITFIASGVNFPDALAVGPLAGALGSPVYLSPKDCIPWPVLGAMQKHRSGTLTLLGGPGALAPNVQAQVACDVTVP